MVFNALHACLCLCHLRSNRDVFFEEDMPLIIIVMTEKKSGVVCVFLLFKKDQQSCKFSINDFCKLYKGSPPINSGQGARR